MFRVINPKKLKTQRGERSLQAIVDASGNAFTYAALSNWENGNYKPKDEKIPSLLKGLGCSYEEISEEVEAASILQK